jgi:hypothetical protein
MSPPKKPTTYAGPPPAEQNGGPIGYDANASAWAVAAPMRATRFASRLSIALRHTRGARHRFAALGGRKIDAQCDDLGALLPGAPGPNQTPRARFLLLVRALEGLCGHEDRLSGKWATFEAKRKRILDECRECLAAKDLKFLDQWLPNTPTIWTTR